MATMTKLGPADHDLALTYDDFVSSEYQSGFAYELIDGRLFVSPEPHFSEYRLVVWLYQTLTRYQFQHPGAINYITQRGRVFIPVRPETTCPQPDLSVYANIPLDYSDDRAIDWPDIQPILVVEVMTGSIWKDLRRNVELYLQVPGIREYWVVDARDVTRPALIQHRRHGSRWVVRHYSFGATLTTKLFPDLRLINDPRQQS